jgi:hypothetical protein
MGAVAPHPSPPPPTPPHPRFAYCPAQPSLPPNHQFSFDFLQVASTYTQGHRGPLATCGHTDYQGGGGEGEGEGAPPAPAKTKSGCADDNQGGRGEGGGGRTPHRPRPLICQLLVAIRA